MLLTEVAMLASGDSKAGCQQLVKELPILSKPTHELSFNQKKKRRKKRAKLGRPVSAEVGLAQLGCGCQQSWPWLPADFGTLFVDIMAAGLGDGVKRQCPDTTTRLAASRRQGSRGLPGAEQHGHACCCGIFCRSAAAS